MKMSCSNCDWTGDYDDCSPAQSLQDRISVGEPYTDVECPECGCLAHEEAPEPEAAPYDPTDPRESTRAQLRQIVGLTDGEDEPVASSPKDEFEDTEAAYHAGASAAYWHVRKLALAALDRLATLQAPLPPLDVRERATIIAALQYWAREEADSVGESQSDIAEDAIATGHGAFPPMREDDVLQLAQHIEHSGLLPSPPVDSITLATLLDAARAHYDDVVTGCDEGIYEIAENEERMNILQEAIEIGERGVRCVTFQPRDMEPGQFRVFWEMDIWPPSGADDPWKSAALEAEGYQQRADPSTQGFTVIDHTGAVQEVDLSDPVF